MKKFLGVLIAAVVAVVLTGCTKKDEGYTYNTYTSVSPSNWNELTYQDNNDTQIMSYIGSGFFEYDYKFDGSGKIIDGEYAVKYSAVSSLTDVTASYVGDTWGIAEGETGRAFKLTLRKDLKWDDGTAIKAEDFVYTMKEQLNPLFLNYRADSFYNSSVVIHNAENYVKQGAYNYSQFVSTDFGDDEYIQPSEFTAGEDGFYYVTIDGVKKDIVVNINNGMSWGDTLSGNMDAADADYAPLAAAADKNGYVKLNAALLLNLQNCIAKLHGYTDVEAYAAKSGDYAYIEFEEMAQFGYIFASLDFSKVGIFVGENEYDIILVLDKSLDLLDADGNLTYHCAYDFGSLPLVKKDLYESCKQAPATGSTLWTSTYQSSLETSASWGPYKLQSFQAGKSYVLVKNANWFGYGIDQYAGMYQTDTINCETIKEWNTAWLKFQAGEIDTIGIDVSIAADYKTSSQAIFTPDDFVASLQLQSNVTALEGRQEDGVNKTILSYPEFREALSVSINRAAFAQATTTSSLAGFGLFNSMHYYDVANGKVYRNEAVAKKVICDVYGVSYTDENLDTQYASVTGYDVTLARKLVDKAYDQAIADGKLKATDKVKLTFGSGAVNEVVTRRYDALVKYWTDMFVGTKLEGKVEFELVDKGTTWANDFRSGAYDICMGGWTGAAWNPGYFLLAYLDPNYMYSSAWDTSSETVEISLPGVKDDGTVTNVATDVFKRTYSLMKWYQLLNKVLVSGKLNEQYRLVIIAALEKAILLKYYSVPLYNNYTAELISYKIEYKSRTHNTFMGYGGFRYMTYNYNNYEWSKFVKKNKGQINYKA